PENDQAATRADRDLVRIDLENASLEIECRPYDLVAMLLNTLLDKLVCAIPMAASRALHSVSMPIYFNVEVRFHLGGLFGRDRPQSCEFNAFRRPILCEDRLQHRLFNV